MAEEDLPVRRRRPTPVRPQARTRAEVAPTTDEAVPATGRRSQPYEISEQPRQMRRDSPSGAARYIEEPMVGEIEYPRPERPTKYKKGGSVMKKAAVASKAKAKPKVKKFAEGGTTGQQLAQRVAVARGRMNAYGGMPRSPTSPNPPIRPRFASNDLEGIKARLNAAGSTPGNKVGGALGGGWPFGIMTGQGDAYTPLRSDPIPAPRNTGTPSVAAGTSGGTEADYQTSGNKRGGLIRAGKKTLRPSGKKPVAKVKAKK